MNKKLGAKLAKREEEGTLRSLSHFEEFVDFFSNDYLGLSREASSDNNISFGGTGSRLISGTSKEVLRVESELADFFGVQSALMLNSGYDANIGFFSAVPQRNDVVFYDEFIHASVRDGLRMGLSKNQSFLHNDLFDLERKIKKATGTIYVVVEGLYSMEGDMAPLLSLCELCKKYKAHLIVDEAHSSGIFGENGKGLVSALELEKEVFARIVTFGKAYGSHGACVLGSNLLKEYLVNFCRPFIYSTALPPNVYLRNLEMIEFPDLNERRIELQSILHYFRSKLKHPGLISEVNSPIQVIEIGDVQKTKEISNRILSSGIAVKPIFSPTVPKGKERLRICFHAFNSTTEVDHLIRQIISSKGKSDQ